MTTARKKIVWIAAAAILLLLVAGIFFIEVAAQRSSFCENCHYMTPYTEQWKNSSHKSVECVACHPAQNRAMFGQFVRYITKTYSPRPRAYVPDEACQKCHADVDKKPVKFLQTEFPHKPHLGTDRRGIRLHCASCHGNSEEAGHVGVDKRVCYLCHFKGQAPAETVAGCGACHGAPSGMVKHGNFQFDMKSYVESGVACSRCHLSVHEGSGRVSREKCYSCHVSRVEKADDAKLVHQQHVTVKEIRCMECHEPIRHGNVKVLSVLEVSCESCHSNLHSGPKEMYLGVGAKGTPDTPSRMFAAQINCIGCHTQVTTQGGSSFLGQGSKSADPRACAACHDARYIPMVDRWKAQGRALTEEAKRLAREGAAIAAGNKKPEVKQLVQDLEFNARFLEQGHPVHNIEYAVRVVQGSGKLLGRLGEAVGRKGMGTSQPLAKNDFSYCLDSCHSFIPRQEPYTWKGADMPHAFHQKTGLPCDTCHEVGSHKALNLASPKDCIACHHESAKADCSRCHVRQSALYRGKVPASVGISAKADSMAGGVGCSDCHDPTQAEPLAKLDEACTACHEADGPKYLETWRKDLAAAREKVTDLDGQAQMAVAGMRRRQSDSAPLAKRLEVIRARVEYLDRAKGVHNMGAAIPEYQRAAKELQAIVDEVEKGRK